jgi:serine protease Do
MNRPENRTVPVSIVVGLLVLSLSLIGCNLVNAAKTGLGLAVEERQLGASSQAVAIADVFLPVTSSSMSRQSSASRGMAGSLDLWEGSDNPLVEIYQRVNPSVVNIRVEQRLDLRGALPMDEFFSDGQGSGFVWDTDGHIVTNNHVIVNADRVLVTFYDDSAVVGEVIGTDIDSDLAVLQVAAAASQLQPVILGDSDALKVGQRAAAIGNPFGQAGTMTQGIISALGRTFSPGESVYAIPEMIQTDAAINPGNSGGPLLDWEGRVVGVNNLIFSSTGVSAGVGFAVPINIVKQVVPALIDEGEYTYPWLGITGTDLTSAIREELDLPSDLRGTLIIGVTEDGPADRSGLRGGRVSASIEGRRLPLGGDVITAIDGRPVRGMDDVLVYLVRYTHPGQDIQLVIQRQGKEQIVDVVLGERPEDLTQR